MRSGKNKPTKKILNEYKVFVTELLEDPSDEY